MIDIKYIIKDIRVADVKTILQSKDWLITRPDFVDCREGFIIYEFGIAKGICLYSPTSFFYENTMSIATIETSLSHRGEGIAQLIIKEIFSLATRLKKNVRFTEYTNEGQKYLKPIINKLGSQFHNSTSLSVIEGYELLF